MTANEICVVHLVRQLNGISQFRSLQQAERLERLHAHVAARPGIRNNCRQQRGCTRYLKPRRRLNGGDPDASPLYDAIQSSLLALQGWPTSC